MRLKFAFVLCLAAVLATALSASGAFGASGGPQVTVRVEGLKKTLLAPDVVKTHAGSLTKGGAPKGACSDKSAAGALDVATKHRWSGKYSSSLHDYFITKILGETESGKKTFWEIFVNNVAASTGACEVKLHRGDQVLFAAVPLSATEFPLGIKAAKQLKLGKTLTIHVFAFDAKGKRKPLANAVVQAGKLKAKTNAKGVAHLKPTSAGTLLVHASKKGYIRALLRVHVSK
ncbi:MAG: DUF4430 domain-containing protein [Solirubrobacterales bacterium]|nr:DUF4430 domain-containing protein [Solirubrobacterales bacterium]